MADVFSRSLELHEKLRGKMTTELKAPLRDAEDLSLLYSPGVAQPCREIAANPERMYDYTWKGNTVAVVSNGTAVLGLGNIGAGASLPVMEGKCALFKRFGGVNAVPLVIPETDPKKFIAIVQNLAVGFGGINLEDIKAPECIEIEKTLQETCDIPIFHDDQHGTAIVVTAAVINALKLVEKKPQECVATVCGVGAAGSAIIKMLSQLGISNFYAFDRRGILNRSNFEEEKNPLKRELCLITNKDAENLSLEQAMEKSDLFLGVSVPNKITAEMIHTMKRDPIVFAMANPDPEIDYDLARSAGARVVGTGRSDYPNQVNNVLAFPGLFRGALDARAKGINDEMKMAAAQAIAALVSEEERKEEYVIPSPFDRRVADSVARSVYRVARATEMGRKFDFAGEETKFNEMS